MATRPDSEALRYLDASCVQHPAGTLAGVQVCGRNEGRLGAIDGVLVEAAKRRVRYFVVERPAFLTRKRYLVPADCLATLDVEGSIIYTDIDDTDGPALERFDISSVEPFSDDDVVDAIFGSSAA